MQRSTVSAQPAARSSATNQLGREAEGVHTDAATCTMRRAPLCDRLGAGARADRRRVVERPLSTFVRRSAGCSTGTAARIPSIATTSITAHSEPDVRQVSSCVLAIPSPPVRWSKLGGWAAGGERHAGDVVTLSRLPQALPASDVAFCPRRCHVQEVRHHGGSPLGVDRRHNHATRNPSPLTAGRVARLRQHTCWRRPTSRRG